ncbi:MAG: InlB B-repeat-containing protein [Opitutaceae bacterium]
MRYFPSILMGFFGILNSEAAILHVDVDATPGGDGMAWASAFNDLQDALDQTIAGQSNEIWIAEGTYYPDRGSNVTGGDRTASFTLKDGTFLYGGFTGTETSRFQRNWEAYHTTLSGRISTDKNDWSLHVCTIETNASVNFDGITVTAGYANGSGTDANQAAGIYSPSNSYWITLNNCTLMDHTALGNGGVTNGGTWTVNNSIFSNNTGTGGGVASGGNWTVRDCSFNSNSATHAGGVANSGTWTIHNSNFSDNSATGLGGVTSSATWTVNDCSFIGNSAGGGGVAHDSTWTANNSSFINNSATRTSGGVAIRGTWTVSHCSFSENFSVSENYSGGNGGVAHFGTWTVDNCNISDNSTASYGGVADRSIWIVSNSSFNGNSATGGGVSYRGTWTVTNCSFGHNSATGGGVAHDGVWQVYNSSFSYNSATGGGVAYDGDWTVDNSSFSYNSATGGGLAHDGIWTVRGSIIDDNNSTGTGYLFESMEQFSNSTSTSLRGTNIIEGGIAVINMLDGYSIDIGTGLLLDADPLFVNPSDADGPDNIHGTSDDGLRLQASSIAIARGNSDLLPLDLQDVDNDGVTNETIPLDRAGFLRVQGDSLDLGAYEYGDSTEQLFTLTTKTESGGSVSPLGMRNYRNGASATITANADAGYLFDAWTGDANGATNPLTGIVNQNLSITATFTPDLSDPDKDGLTNYQEIVIYKTNPNLKYSLDTTLSDGDIVSAGFNPTIDYHSLISSINERIENAEAGIIEGSYIVLQQQLQRSEDLLNWSSNPDDIFQIKIPLIENAGFFRFGQPSISIMDVK